MFLKLLRLLESELEQPNLLQKLLALIYLLQLPSWSTLGLPSWSTLGLPSWSTLGL
jgi:hypothetical protein